MPLFPGTAVALYHPPYFPYCTMFFFLGFSLGKFPILPGIGTGPHIRTGSDKDHWIPCRMPWAKGFSKTAIRPSLKQPDVQQPSPISSQPSRSLCFCPQDHPPSWGWTSPVLLFLPLYGIMNYRCHLWEMAEKYTDPYYSQVRRRENTVPGKKGVCWLCVEL